MLLLYTSRAQTEFTGQCGRSSARRRALTMAMGARLTGSLLMEDPLGAPMDGGTTRGGYERSSIAVEDARGTRSMQDPVPIPSCNGFSRPGVLEWSSQRQPEKE